MPARWVYGQSRYWMNFGRKKENQEIVGPYSSHVTSYESATLRAWLPTLLGLQIVIMIGWLILNSQ